MVASENRVRSSRLLSRPKSRLIIVDVQERLWPVIQHKESLATTIRFLIEAASLLQIPIVATEQYPRGLGRTIPELGLESTGHVCLEKIRFSAAEVLFSYDETDQREADTAREPAVDRRHQVVLTGIEAHICVQQTAFDLAAADYDVFVVRDAVGSRKTADLEAALERMRSQGITVTTVESVVFEWCETAEAPEFKLLSQLVRQR
jgi:nicotinamidase-related amidase